MSTNLSVKIITYFDLKRLKVSLLSNIPRRKNSPFQTAFYDGGHIDAGGIDGYIGILA